MDVIRGLFEARGRSSFRVRVMSPHALPCLPDDVDKTVMGFIADVEINQPSMVEMSYGERCV